MRLTERKVCYPKSDKEGNLTKVNYIEIKDKGLAEEKLCQLEDIEDELGIELVTLFKALENGIYFKNPINGSIDNSFFYDSVLEISSEKGLSLISNVMDMLFFYEDYGKTWALTKEELE